jgi:hypothetical protein
MESSMKNTPFGLKLHPWIRLFYMKSTT